MTPPSRAIVIGFLTLIIVLSVYVAPVFASEGRQADGITYIVRVGDTLWALAQRFQTTVTAIKQRNGLKGTLIRPGQRLIIPRRRAAARSCGSRYVVRRGDTLSGIAKRCRVSAQKIRALNRLTNPNRIRAGQVLKLTSTKRNNLTASGVLQAKTQSGPSGPRRLAPIKLYLEQLPAPAPYP